MPVQYVMIYFDKPHWKKWEKLPLAEQKKLKEEFKKAAYKRLDQGAPSQ